MSEETTWSDWEISQCKLQPVPFYLNRLNTFLSQREGDDISVCFRYAPRYKKKSTFVHASRMEWAGGPFRAMIRRSFSEQRTKIVSLSEDDDPEAFSVIRDFLYAKSISLSAVPFSVLLRTARAAHRWQLTPLFSGILHFMEDDRLLQDQNSLLEAVDVFALPGVPREVLLYFWNCVGINFGNLGNVKERDVTSGKSQKENSTGAADSSENLSDDENDERVGAEVQDYSTDDDRSPTMNVRRSTRLTLSRAHHLNPRSSSHLEAVNINHLVADTMDMETNVANSETDDLPIQARICPRFPNLWALALAHGVVDIALQSILCYWTGFDGPLLDVVLQYLEPRIKEDEVVCRLIGQLSRKSEILEAKLENSNLDVECSSRAVRLLAKSLNRSRYGRQEMRYSWRLALAEEQNFVRDVFFCPDFPAISNVVYRDVTEVAARMLGSGNRNEQGARKRSRPSKYELLCQSSVRLTLSVGCDSNEAVVLVCWKSGIVFLDCDSTLAVLVEIMDDGCVCTANDSKYPGKRGCLGREMSTTGLYEKGLLTVRLDDELLEAYRDAHGPHCAVTISLVVKLLPA
eukprot:GFKZ01008762.1.p1 GENE.GFKZ01008762.1~~GFKZ01008762.1.p1  ORF type:complete len:574 (+),score=60.34 GFKZ01008762.1:185-1906(+)